TPTSSSPSVARATRCSSVTGTGTGATPWGCGGRRSRAGERGRRTGSGAPALVRPLSSDDSPGPYGDSPESTERTRHKAHRARVRHARRRHARTRRPGGGHERRLRPWRVGRAVRGRGLRPDRRRLVPLDHRAALRTTYQLMAGYWPQVTDPDDHVAAALNTSPKHVVSTTLTDPQWSNTVGVISEDVVAAVRALKERPGDELQVHGCWQLVQTLHNAGLVDEYRLLEFPVVVGGGKRVFHDGAAASNFTVVHSETTGSGAVYRVLQPVPFQAGTVAVEDGKDVA